MFQVQFAQAIERSVKDLLDKHCAWLPLHPDQMTHALLVVVLCATVSVAENVVRANLVPSRQMTLYIFFCLFFCFLLVESAFRNSLGKLELKSTPFDIRRADT